MLRPWRDIQPHIGILILASGTIVRVVIIGNRVKGIDIDAIDGIHHFNEPVQPYPSIVVDWNTKILIDCSTTQANAATSICLVQLHHAVTSGGIEPGVTRD